MHVESITKGTGYFGKIPTAGDFIRHNLTRAFVEPWDNWLQNAVTNSRLDMGDKWLDTYLTSPIYRFVLTPGVCGESGWQGVLMPSVDRVGRYFPMTICQPIPSSLSPYSVLLEKNDWLEKAEAVVLSILENSLSIADLNKEIIDLDSNTISATSPESHELRSTKSDQSARLAIREPLENLDHLTYSKMLDKVLSDTVYAYSIWSTAGSSKVAPSILTTQGLPPINSFGAMLDGKWNQWNWNDGNSELSVDNFIDEDKTDPWDR